MPMLTYNPNAGEFRGKLPNAANPLMIGGVRFMPGTCQVSDRDWETLLAHPAYSKLIQMRLDDGKFRLIQSPKKDTEPSLADYNLADAKDMIFNCTDLDLLRRWQSEDTRKGAQDAIAKQIDHLSPRPEEPKAAAAAAASGSDDDELPTYA